MNFQQLTTFCTVLNEGSMTAAANKLCLTQPAVSQQIKSLEEEMGVPLLVRGVRQVKPTMQGQLLFDYSKKILHLTQQAEVAMKTMSQEISGNLRIATINSIGMYLISPIVGLFLKHNENLNIQLSYGSYESINTAMASGDLDIAIMPEMKEEFGQAYDQYEEKFLMRDELWLVGSGRDTTLPQRASIKEFVKRPVVIFSEMYPSFRRHFEKLMMENNLEFHPVFETDNVGTLKRVIESGLGWGFLPAHSIKKQVRSHRMSHIHVNELDSSVNICLYSRRTDKVRQMTEVFYRAIQRQALG